MSKMKMVKDTLLSIKGWESLDGAIEQLQNARSKGLAEGWTDLTLEIYSREDYDYVSDYEHYLEIKGLRPQTDIEMFHELQEDRKRKAEKEKRELEQLDYLLAKYGNTK